MKKSDFVFVAMRLQADTFNYPFHRKKPSEDERSLLRVDYEIPNESVCGAGDLRSSFCERQALELPPN